jgi:hypothetical protein
MYYYNIGIPDQFIMLHLPTEELLDIISDVQKEIPDMRLRLLYWNKEGAGKNPVNEEYLRVLTDAAQKEGFRWIVGSDSDEFLMLQKHKAIYDLIEDYDSHNFVSLIFPWVNYYLTDIIQCQPFYEIMTRRRPHCMPWTKSIGKFNPSMYYVQGLHHIADMENGQVSSNIYTENIPEETAFFAHFPYRSKQQYVDKNKTQAKKFNDWRAEKLSADPLYFDKKFDSTIMSHKWPLTHDSDIETTEIDTNFIIKKIPNTHLMEKLS